MSILEVNAETQEVIEREPTEAELDQKVLDEIESAAKAQVEAAKATAKAALLNRLGITEDEAKLLLA